MQNPNAGLLPPGQQVNPLGRDGFNPSAGLNDPTNPAQQAQAAMMGQNMAGGMFDGILRSQAQQLMVTAASGQGDVQQMGQQLMQEYQQIKQMGIPLSPQTEQLVQKALQMAGIGQDQQGQQPQGGAQQGGGGAPQAGGGAPQGGGGAPQGGGGAPQAGGGADQGGGTPQAGGAQEARPAHSAPRPRRAEAAQEAPQAETRPEQTTPTPTPTPTTTGSDTPSTTTVNPPDPATTTSTPAETRRIGRMEDRVQQAGPQNNCGSTAIINAMQQMEQSQTGWGEGMKIEPQPDGSTKVTMRDGYSTTLSADQIKQAGEATGYKGDPASVDRANTYMGAAANRYGETNGTNFKDSLTALNGNNWPGTTQHTGSPRPGVDKYFGVEARPIKDLKTLDGEGVAILANGTHTDVARTSKNNGKTYMGDHGSRNNGRAREYDGNIYSNGQNTGRATEGWTIQDRPKPDSTGSTPIKTQTVNYTPPKTESGPTVQLASYTPSRSTSTSTGGSHSTGGSRSTGGSTKSSGGSTKSSGTSVA